MFVIVGSIILRFHCNSMHLEEFANCEGDQITLLPTGQKLHEKACDWQLIM